MARPAPVLLIFSPPVARPAAAASSRRSQSGVVRRSVGMLLHSAGWIAGTSHEWRRLAGSAEPGKGEAL